MTRLNHTPAVLNGGLVVRGCACLVVCLLAAGCGGGKASVSGKVTYKKQDGAEVPVTGGNIYLHQGTSKSPDYTLTIGADGTFRAEQVPPGEYSVAIDNTSLKGMGPVKPPPGMKIGPKELKQLPDLPNMPVYVAIPSKYLRPATSGLTWKIGSGSETKNFELTD